MSQPDAIHIATEGPLGLAARRYATSHNLDFTTAFHTRFPEYIRSRTKLPLGATYALLRWFHSPAKNVMAPTNTVIRDLEKWQIGNPVLWPRGVDLTIFNPCNRNVKKPTGNIEKLNASIAKLDNATKPVFIYVGRVAVEKNLSGFLDLDLPGEKLSLIHI